MGSWRLNPYRLDRALMKEDWRSLLPPLPRLPHPCPLRHHRVGAPLEGTIWKQRASLSTHWLSCAFLLVFSASRTVSNTFLVFTKQSYSVMFWFPTWAKVCAIFWISSFLFWCGVRGKRSALTSPCEPWFAQSQESAALCLQNSQALHQCCKSVQLRVLQITAERSRICCHYAPVLN